MSSDFHIKFDGVEGESSHKDHKGEIEILAWSWGVNQASSANSGGGSGKGKANAQDFHFTHRYDKASPVLAKHCVSGKHFGSMKLTARKAVIIGGFGRTVETTSGVAGQYSALAQFGLPLEGAAILLGIDQILDMGRTGVNVMGNCIATVVVAVFALWPYIRKSKT